MTPRYRYQGLTDTEVLESRKKYGSNLLTPLPRVSLWRQLGEKFVDPLIIILLIAGGLAIGIALYEYISLGYGARVFFEPGGIFVAILIATGLSFYFERQADREFSILNQVNDDEPVEVIRSGQVIQIRRREVVVGDIVLLSTGGEVPADGLLLEATQLTIDESTLTGEPLCCKSTREEDQDPCATYPTNQVLKGTKVMEGYGIYQVLMVGDHTEQGKVYEAAQIDDSIKTPLNEQLDSLSKWISRISYSFAVFIVVGRLVGYFISNGTEELGDVEQLAPFVAYMLQTLMIAVTLIVVAVPEGLPMAVTLSLAYSMRRMLRSNNLVRKMHASETMGATTVICTDKTGTLTQNQMKVEEIKVFPPDLSRDLLHEGLAVNATADLDDPDMHHPQVIGNPTEGALLLWLHREGVNYRKLRDEVQVIAELPFSAERKYMATVVESSVLPDHKILYVKGAPEIVYAMCSHSDVDRLTLDRYLTEYQDRAMRTLGFAYQVLESECSVINEERVETDGLKFIAVASIADPVREDVPQAIRECLQAGIQVKIVTGDTIGTAKEIGRQIGLWSASDGERQVITGPEFSALTDDELFDRVEELKIIARARPMDKKRLVEILQQRNHVVAVTGDGTNDAPALHVAHVGLSMGAGTSVAKEASDITIIDNSFASIGKAVMWGRSLYQNIQRFLLFQLTVNVTACFLVLFGAFMGTESPLTVTQMLWINLIMDTFAAMALASLPPSRRVMRDKPRDRSAFILTRGMIANVIGVGGFFFILLLGLLYIFQHAQIHQLTDLLSLELTERGDVSPYELTLLFTIFVMTHFFYLFNARAFATGRSALHLKGCHGLLTMVVIIMIGQVAMVEVPGVQQFFNVSGLKFQDWLIIIVGASLVLWVREAWHIISNRLGQSPRHE